MEKGNKSASPRIKSFGRVVSIAFQQARQSEFDVLARRRFREFREVDVPEGNRPAPVGDAGDLREARTPQEGNRVRALPDSGQLEGSLPECP
jgi:hypothetical protein